jgi:electron transport complex protein RnfG
MLKTMRKHGVTLALFAAGSTGLTAAINELTKHHRPAGGPAAKGVIRSGLPADRYNNDLLKSCFWSAPRRWAKASIKCGSPKITINRSAR